jgi:hypothetical protein
VLPTGRAERNGSWFQLWDTAAKFSSIKPNEFCTLSVISELEMFYTGNQNIKWLITWGASTMLEKLCTPVLSAAERHNTQGKPGST